MTSLLLLRCTLLFTLLAPADEDVQRGLALDPAVVTSIVEHGMDDSQVMQLLDDLVNGIGPRLTGSTNLSRAEEWTLQYFRALGLDARLEPWGEVAVGFDRGPWTGAMLEPERVELSFITRAWTAGTDGPLSGPAVVAPEDDAALEELADQLPGSWVVSRGQPFRGRPDEASRAFLERRSEAYDAAGIAGVVTPARSGERLIMSGNMRVSWDDLPTRPGVILVKSQFDDIVARLERDEPVVLEFSIDNRFVEGPVVQNNVVADLRGAVHPDEYVIVGGHLDSWDGATGATDNGTGVATTLEAARLLVTSGARPDRTIRFMLWGGEEQGLLGSSKWAADNSDIMQDISAVLVHDGGTNYLSGLGVTRAMEQQVRTALQPVSEYAATRADAQPFELRVVPGLPRDGASDHVPFKRQGVPGFFWAQDGTAIYDHTHHTQHDTYDQVVPEYQRHSAVVVALSALGLAMLPEKLSRRGLLRENRLLGVFLGEDGLTINGVAPDGLADRHGIEQGDRFVSINGVELDAGELATQRDIGEGRKVIAWKHGDAIVSAVFEWDAGHIDRDPEAVQLTTDDGVSLRGDYYMGKVDAPAHGSAIILLHMFRSDRHAWLPVRDELYEAGIATLALDMRGHGESVDAEGTLAARVEQRDTALFEAMAHDVEAAVNWLVERGYDGDRIGLMGASVGCSVALRAAVADAQLAGVAALTPGLTYLGLDSTQDAVVWDDRPLLLVASTEEADGGAQPLFDAIKRAEPWSGVDLVILPGTGIHGTRMFGSVEGIEQRLADWWAAALK